MSAISKPFRPKLISAALIYFVSRDPLAEMPRPIGAARSFRPGGHADRGHGGPPDMPKPIGATRSFRPGGRADRGHGDPPDLPTPIGAARSLSPSPPQKRRRHVDPQPKAISESGGVDDGVDRVES